MNNTSKKTVEMVQAALMVALIAVLSFVPYVGYIKIPILAIQATTIHIPVIIGSILLGPRWGAFLGACFGLTSLINNTFSPGVTSFVFSPFISGNPLSLIICFLPRILVGVVPHYVYCGMQKLFAKKQKKAENVSLMLSGVVGSMTNTILVMSMIYLFYGRAWAVAKEIPYETILAVISSVIFINGTLEAIVAAILASAICKVMFTAFKFNTSKGKRQ